MTYTEQEATKLWCRTAGMSGTCVASGCMAWRWAQKPNPDWKPDNSGMMSWPVQDRRNDPPMYIDDTTRGFCGLAGRP